MTEGLQPIRFIQYLRPDGRKESVYIDRPEEIAHKAHEIWMAGFRLEAEVLIGGMVSLTIGDDEGDYAFELSANGPGLENAVDRLIMHFDIEGDHRS